ncbi:unnamed protein product, partial [Pylaiella littoralis]
ARSIGSPHEGRIISTFSAQGDSLHLFGRDGHMASCPQLKYVRPGSESLVENPKAYVTERRSIESTRSTNSSIPRLRETSPVPTCYLGGCAEIAVAAAAIRPPPPIPVAA